MIFFLLLVVAVVVGAFGYRAATRFEADYGRRACGLPRLIWAALCFITVFGLLLLWNARRQQTKETQSPEPAFSSSGSKKLLLGSLVAVASLFIGLITWAQLSGPPK